MVGVNFDILRGSISLPLDLSISYYFFVVNNFFCEHNNTKKTSRTVFTVREVRFILRGTKP